MSDSSRRFTDREVALVLKRASEIDEVSEARSGPAGGLSLSDLSEIAAEVGISKEALQRAVSTLERGGPSRSVLEGAPLVRRAVHAVPRALGESDIAELMRHVDARAEGAGTVTEALGSVRWAAADRFVGTQVTVTPKGGQTSIDVMEKTPARLRRVVHFLPVAWSLIGALPLMEATPGVLPTIAIGAAALVAGTAVGRAAFSLLSNRSEARVKRLAADLADAANRASEGAQVLESGPSERDNSD
ncbi:MAG: hypothetical protein AAF389_19375 [Gemmatimonadota bacterium]